MIRPAYRPIFSLLLLALLMTACGPVSTAPTATPLPAVSAALPTSAPLSPLAQYNIPPYYASNYIDIVEASKEEDGLVIYSIMAENNWAPIIRIFNTHYPWIKVTTYDLSATEVFARYTDEVKSETRTADIVVSSDQVGWQTFLIKEDVVMYRSQEDLFVPDWSNPTFGVFKSSTGLYTLSSDPMVIIFNKKLVPIAPHSIADIAELVQSDINAYKGQIVTYDAELNATGFVTNWFWINRTKEEGWENLSAIGQAAPALLTSGSAMVDAVGKGGVFCLCHHRIPQTGNLSRSRLELHHRRTARLAAQHGNYTESCQPQLGQTDAGLYPFARRPVVARTRRPDPLS
jgi:hypothetical protein